MKIIPHFSAEGLSNEYLIVDDEENGIIVDPAHVDGELLEIIEKMCNRLVAVLITHKHQSHTAGLGTLLKIYNLHYLRYNSLFLYLKLRNFSHYHILFLILSNICFTVNRIFFLFIKIKHMIINHHIPYFLYSLLFQNL